MAKRTKKTSDFTILLIPGSGSEVRKIRIPTPVARYLPHFGIMTGVLVFTFLSLFFYYRHGHVQHQQSKGDLVHLQNTMLEVDTQISLLEKTLERVTSFDQKLRMMTHLRDPERQLAMGPLNPYQDSLHSEIPSDSPFDDLIPYIQGEEETSGSPDELLVKTRRLNAQGLEREQSLATLTDQLRDQEQILASTPATWPLQGYVTSRFGMRISPFTKIRKFHAGIDIAAAPGTPVYSPANATVVFVGRKSGYGKTLILDHGYGIITCYAHNSELLVKKGQKIKRGQVIAKVGSTGRSTGPHLHYEVRLAGNPKNPELFILN